MSIKSIARTAFVFVGAALGGPFGAVTGALLGNILFPPEYEDGDIGGTAPRAQTEIEVSTSIEGLPIYKIFGTAMVPCNFLYSEKMTHETVTEPVNAADFITDTIFGWMDPNPPKAKAEKQKRIKYYKTFAVGFCEGPVDITRYFEDGQPVIWEDLTTVSMYAGNINQSIDSGWEDAVGVGNISAMRGLCYMFANSKYLGYTSRLPEMQIEAHNYPYYSDLAKSPYVWRYLEDRFAEDTHYYCTGNNFQSDFMTGIPYHRTNKQIIIYQADKLKYYDDNLDFIKNVSFSGESWLNWPTKPADIVARADQEDQYAVMFDEDGGLIVHVISTDADIGSTGIVRYTVIDITDGGSVSGSQTTVLTTANDETESCCKMARSRNYAFGWYTFEEGAEEEGIVKYSKSGTQQALYEKGGGGWPGTWPTGKIEDMACIDSIVDDEVYLAVLGYDGSNTKVYVYDSTLTYKDDVTLAADDRWEHCYLCELKGIDGFFAYDKESDDAYIIYYDADNTSLSIVQTHTDFKNSDGLAMATSSSTWGGICPRVDGGLIIVDTYYDGYWDSVKYEYHELSHDLNIATGIMMVADDCNIDYTNEIDITSLQTLSDWCFDNDMGVSKGLTRRKEGKKIIDTWMTHIQALWYENNNGKIAFTVPQNSDSSVSTIEKKHVLVANEKTLKPKATVSIKGVDSRANRLNIYFCDRSRDYTQNTMMQFDNMLGQEESGVIREKILRLDWFMNREMAARAAYRIETQDINDVDVYDLHLVPSFLDMEIGECYTLDLSTLGLSSQKVRVTSLEYPELSTGDPVRATFKREENYLNNFVDLAVEGATPDSEYETAPTDVEPIIFEWDAIRYDSGSDTDINIGIGIIRSTSNEFGCDIYMSKGTSTTYELIGTIFSFAKKSDIAANVSDDDTEITITEGYDSFEGYTITEQMNGLSFCLAGEKSDTDDPNLTSATMEFLSYRGTRASGDNLILENCHRGKDYTMPKDHDTDAYLYHIPVHACFTKNMGVNSTGIKLNFKFCAFNSFGTRQALADVDTYTYYVKGYGQKATHAAALEIKEGGTGQGSRKRFTTGDITIIWEDTYRLGGLNSGILDTSTTEGYSGFVSGDVDNYDVLIYDSDGTTLLVTKEDIGNVNTYTYTNATRVSDGVGTHYWIGIVPKNPRGDVRNVNVAKKEVILT